MDQIKKHHNAVLQSITKDFKVEDTDTNIEKGTVAEMLTYGGAGIPMSKTGKDILAGVDKKIAECKVKKEHCLKEMLEYLAKCNKVPTQSVDDYQLKGCTLENAPKSFPWRDVESYDSPKNKQYVDTVVISETKESEEKSENPFREYNKYQRKYIEHCVDVCYLETIQGGLDPKKQYQLTIKQCVQLGL